MKVKSKPLLDIFNNLRKENRLTDSQCVLHDVMLMMHNPDRKKEPLTKKQKKRRKRNKMAKISRRKNQS